MKIVCAWCECDMGTKEGGTPDEVTHGICEICYYRLKTDPHFQKELEDIKAMREANHANHQTALTEIVGAGPVSFLGNDCGEYLHH